MRWSGLGVNYHWDRNTWVEVEKDIQDIAGFCKWIRPGIADYRSDIKTGYINTTFRFCQMAQVLGVNLYWGICNKRYFGPSTWIDYVTKQKQVLQYAQDNLKLDIYDAGNEEELKIDNNPVVSITRVGSTATITTQLDHEMRIGDSCMVSGCTEPQYNGTFHVETIPTSKSLTVTISGTPNTPATGNPIFYSYTVAGLYQAIDDLVKELKPLSRVPIAYSISGHWNMRNFYRANGLGAIDILMLNQYDKLNNFYNELKKDRDIFGRRVQISEWGVSIQSRNGIIVNNNWDVVRRETMDRLNIIKSLGYDMYMYYAYAEGSEGFCLKSKDGTFSTALQVMKPLARQAYITI